MKKYIFLIYLATLGFFTACDYNDENFPGLDDMSKPTNTTQYNYTVTKADITTIYNAAKSTLPEAADQLNKDGMFSDLAPAADLIPILLKSKYYAVDKGASANITYQFKHGRTDYLAALSNPSYQLTEADYKAVWGKEFVSALTPDKAPATEIPALLATNFSSAVEGDYKIVDYYYSAEEPEYDIVEVSYLSENFDEYTAGSGVAVAIPGWINKDVKAALFWQCRSFSGNNYAQVSANKSGAENDVWLITKQVDLTEAIAPKFTFDYTSGYYNADCLTVWVSENFDGAENTIETATWTDITNNFTFVNGTATSYGTLTSVGIMDFSAYAGKKVYIAFRYEGNGIDNSATSTVQIDKIKLSEVKSAMSVANTKRVYAAYNFNGTKWTENQSIVVVQPEDYALIGKNYLNISEAPNYLPQLLTLKFPFAQEETVKTIVFKSSNTANYADEYILSEKQWVLNTFVEEITSQFVVSNDGWKLDPTITITLVTADYQLMVDYVKANFSDTPALVHEKSNAEYYYGFSSFYANISTRDSDRLKDPSYAALSSTEEKQAFLQQRTEEGLEVLLSLKYPNATSTVSGIKLYAYVIFTLYDGAVTTKGVKYKFECIGGPNPSQWKFIETVKE